MVTNLDPLVQLGVVVEAHFVAQTETAVPGRAFRPLDVRTLVCKRFVHGRLDICDATTSLLLQGGELGSLRCNLVCAL